MIELYDIEDKEYIKVLGNNFIYNVESYFNLFVSSVPDTKEIRCMLKDIEKAEYSSSSRFKDRFGGELYYKSLSTSCKCVMLAYLFRGQIINFVEAGVGAYETLLKLNFDCKIAVPGVDWLKYINFMLDGKVPEDIEIKVAGDKTYRSYSDYEKNV